MDMCKIVWDQESVKKTNEGLEAQERECTSIQNRAQEHFKGELLSQGMSVEDVALSVLWWYGPENLKNSNEVLVKADIERFSGFYQEKVI